ncbi:MAG: hypothetical protein II969_13185 [Anaerolineaceae bacterium]|nr:hypothetical protein [Anaerolineaceae bacterium]
MNEYPTPEELEDIPEITDFSHAIRNPFAGRIKRQVTMNMNIKTLSYFQEMADQLGVPYQTLINLYLADCANNKRKITFTTEPNNSH